MIITSNESIYITQYYSIIMGNYLPIIIIEQIKKNLIIYIKQ